MSETKQWTTLDTTAAVDEAFGAGAKFPRSVTWTVLHRFAETVARTARATPGGSDQTDQLVALLREVRVIVPPQYDLCERIDAAITSMRGE